MLWVLLITGVLASSPVEAQPEPAQLDRKNGLVLNLLMHEDYVAALPEAEVPPLAKKRGALYASVYLGNSGLYSMRLIQRGRRPGEVCLDADADGRCSDSETWEVPPVIAGERWSDDVRPTHDTVLAKPQAETSVETSLSLMWLGELFMLSTTSERSGTITHAGETVAFRLQGFGPSFDTGTLILDTNGDGVADGSSVTETFRAKDPVPLGDMLWHWTAPANGDTLTLTPLSTDQEILKLGAPIPDFSLPDLDGELVDVASFRGRYLLIDVWGTWCVGCIQQFPKLRAFHDAHGEKIAILGLAHDQAPRVRAFLRKESLPWNHVVDEPRDTAALLKIFTWPTYMLVDPEGILLYAGSDVDQVLAAYLERQ